MTKPGDATPGLLAERLRKATEDFEGARLYNANAEDSDCEPHWSAQKELADASKAAIEAADFLSTIQASAAASKARIAELEKALKAIVVRCEEGDKQFNWLPTIGNIARRALPVKPSGGAE